MTGLAPAPISATRKRSRDNREGSDDDDAHSEPRNGGGEAPSPFAHFFKRTKSDGDLEGLGLIPVSEAWLVDIDDLLAAHGLTVRGPEPVIRVLATLGGIPVQYEVLCELASSNALPSSSVRVEMLALCPRSIPRLAPEPSPVPIAFCPTSHFVRLGLLHPQGGGDIPLDSLVLLDGGGRRRLVVPFGWGPGQHVLEEHGGRMVRERMAKALTEGLKVLVEEAQSSAPR